MSKAPNPEKGARYFAQLDQALCNGNWTEIQELARKTDKHAPERRCTEVEQSTAMGQKLRDTLYSFHTHCTRRSADSFCFTPSDLGSIERIVQHTWLGRARAEVERRHCC